MSGQDDCLADIQGILADPKSKEFKDLRDRAAYMFITGAHPSHLRIFFTRALTRISKMHNKPVSLDGRSGNLKIDEVIASKLELSAHPMALKAQQYVNDGWRIRVSHGPNARKPFTKVFLHRGKDEEVTVNLDGYVKDSWS
jgi:hypothetical protein